MVDCLRYEKDAVSEEKICLEVEYEVKKKRGREGGGEEKKKEKKRKKEKQRRVKIRER